jgi:hypothetical protein
MNGVNGTGFLACLKRHQGLLHSEAKPIGCLRVDLNALAVGAGAERLKVLP